MYSLIRELFSLLTAGQRRRFYSLQIMVVLMAIMELLGVASIGPFMALVADMSLLDTNPVLNSLYTASGLDQPRDFLFLTGLLVLIMLGIASALSIFTTWRLSLFSYSVGTEIGDRLYQHYLKRDWLFHAGGSSAQLTKQIATEAMRVTTHIIQPLMTMNARLVVAIFISVGIIVYNPMVALVGVSVFVLGYVIIYKTVRARMARNGRLISAAATERFRLMNEGFGGIKDVLLTHRSDDFIEQFTRSGNQFARGQGVNQALGVTPRYFMELVAFGTLITLVLALLAVHGGALEKVLPTLAIYALAGFKLLPAFQQIYGAVASIRGNTAAFEAIKPDLIAARAQDSARQTQAGALALTDARHIRLNQITFTYPNKDAPAVDGVDISIPVNSTVGFVGESGSGKSTLIDILLGLIQPQQGRLMLDDTVIDETRLKAWQQNIGFVPQSIFLSEGSITENVAFGVRRQDIDLERVKTAIGLAHLDQLVTSLPQGLDTRVGERGVQLSGGQRQRIGIARALYNDAGILVFDEATSSLDGMTEKAIMDAIQELSGTRTIILIAHRLKTVRECDKIYMMGGGKVIAEGRYEELVANSLRFRQMARYA